MAKAAFPIPSIESSCLLLHPGLMVGTMTVDDVHLFRSQEIKTISETLLDSSGGMHTIARGCHRILVSTLESRARPERPTSFSDSPLPYEAAMSMRSVPKFCSVSLRLLESRSRTSPEIKLTVIAVAGREKISRGRRETM